MTYIPAGRYPIRPTHRDLADLKEAILGVAPEALDTLQELAAALGNDPAYFTTVANQVSELNTDVTDVVAALGIAENDSNVGTFTSPTLPDGTTLRAVLEAFASAYDTTKSNLETADSDLSDRLDVLEADPATQSYVDAQLAALIDSAPGVLDTLNELAAAIGDDADFIGTMNAANTALSNRLDTLEADPTTQTVVDALETALDGRLDVLEADPTTQTLLDAEETARENADSAIEGRLDTLEADPTTQTLLDAETTTRANADSLLSGRLDVLETDPTTAAAVAAVQADVDQNESDADAALALKAPLADPTFTGDVSFGSLGRVNPSGNELKFLNDTMSSGIVLGNKITLQANSEVEVFGDLVIESGLTDAADDIAAAAAGVDVNQLYRNGSVVMIRVS